MGEEEDDSDGSEENNAEGMSFKIEGDEEEESKGDNDD